MTTIEMLVQNMYSGLNPSEQAAASYFLKHPDHIFRYPLATLAKMSGTSQGAWVRFCKNIGFDGIKGLKNALFTETNTGNSQKDSVPKEFSDIRDIDSTLSLAKHVCQTSIQAIENTLQLLDTETIEKVAVLITQAKAIRCFGVGASGLVAEDINAKFQRLGYSALFNKDLHSSYTLASVSSASDIALLLSDSGETAEILTIADILKSVGTPTVAITRYNSSNSLSCKADYVLYTNSKEVLMRSSATSSRIAQLCLCDILFMAVASHDYPNIEEKLKLSYENCHPQKQ